MIGGFKGKVLEVNLTEMKSEIILLSEKIVAQYIGGLGIAIKLACDLMQSKIAPLSPENVIVLGVGPLVGTNIPASSRVYTVTKLPQSQSIGWSGGGGFVFGTAFKQAGFDHLIIRGRAPFPVYLEIIDGCLNIRKAETIWGLGIDRTTEVLSEKYGSDTGVLAIGPAGENRVVFSMAFIDAISTIGRGGLGAVLGSKNLKAIVVKGNQSVTVAHPKTYRKIVRKLLGDIKESPGLKEWQDLGLFKSFGFIPPEMYKKIKKKRVACISCPIGDKDVVEIREGDHCGLIKKTSSAVNLFLPMIYGMAAYQDCVKIIAVIDDLGMDMFEFFGILQFTDKLIKRGIIPRDNTLPVISIDNYHATRSWADIISRRESLGNILADGFNGIRENFGSDPRYEDPPLIKGMTPYVGPKGPLPWDRFGTMELGQVLEQRGAHVGASGSPTYFAVRSLDKFPRHMERMGMTEAQIKRVIVTEDNNSRSPNIKIGKMLVYSQNWFAILGSLGLCARAQVNRFFNLKTCVNLYNAVTGVELSEIDFTKNADRIWTLLRHANARQGIDRTHDQIPEQWIKENPFRDYVTAAPLNSKDYELMIDDYYEERGWNKITGQPPEEMVIDF